MSGLCACAGDVSKAVVIYQAVSRYAKAAPFTCAGPTPVARGSEVVDLEVIFDSAEVDVAPGLDASIVGGIKRKLPGAALCRVFTDTSDAPATSLPSPVAKGELRWEWRGRSVWVRVGRSGSVKVELLLEQLVPIPLSTQCVRLEPVKLGEVLLDFRHEVVPCLEESFADPLRLTLDGMVVGRIWIHFSVVDDLDLSDVEPDGSTIACCAPQRMLSDSTSETWACADLSTARALRQEEAVGGKRPAGGASREDPTSPLREGRDATLEGIYRTRLEMIDWSPDAPSKGASTVVWPLMPPPAG